MTIVDSINKITESLGGDTTGVQTAAEAIDALGPVISGGGGSMGSAVITSDEEGGITVELNNLTSFDAFLEIDKPNFTEPTLVFHNSFLSSIKKAGEHGFEVYDVSSHINYTFEWVTYDEIFIEYDQSTDSFSGSNTTLTYARAYENGTWGDWQIVETN